MPSSQVWTVGFRSAEDGATWYNVGASLSPMLSGDVSLLFPQLFPHQCTQTLDISMHGSAPAPSHVWRPFIPPMVLLLLLLRCWATRSYQGCTTMDLKPPCWWAALNCRWRQYLAEEIGMDLMTQSLQTVSFLEAPSPFSHGKCASEVAWWPAPLYPIQWLLKLCLQQQIIARLWEGPKLLAQVA